MGRPGLTRLALAFLLSGAACRKAQEAPLPPPKPEALPMPAAALDPGIAEMQRDRRFMVRPAPSGFKPKAEGPMLEVRLVPESSTIKLGSPLRVRLEVQNVGTEAWYYLAGHSLLKSRASHDNDWRHWRFSATGPDGKRFELHGALGEGSFDDAQVMEPAAAERLAERVRAFQYLRIDLAPGETIASLRRDSDVADAWVPKEVDRFVELANRYELERPGIYEFYAEHTAPRYNPKTRAFDPEKIVRAAPLRIEVIR